MAESYEIFHADPIEQTQLDQVFAALPEFHLHRWESGDRQWIFTPRRPGLAGCSWISDSWTDSVQPDGPMEPEDLDRVIARLGRPACGSIVIDNSRDDPEGKNVLFLTLLLAERWPNLTLFDWQGHFYTVPECRSLWEAGNGLPKDEHDP